MGSPTTTDGNLVPIDQKYSNWNIFLFVSKKRKEKTLLNLFDEPMGKWERVLVKSYIDDVG